MNSFQKRVHKDTVKALKGEFPGAELTTCGTYGEFKQVIKAIKRIEARNPVVKFSKKKPTLYQKMSSRADKYLG